MRHICNLPPMLDAEFRLEFPLHELRNAMTVAPMPIQHMPQQGQLPGADKKIAAGICGILLGGFGVISLFWATDEGHLLSAFLSDWLSR